jgi:hypothetical protein
MLVKRSRRFVMAAVRPVVEKASLEGIDPHRWGLSLE